MIFELLSSEFRESWFNQSADPAISVGSVENVSIPGEFWFLVVLSYCRMRESFLSFLPLVSWYAIEIKLSSFKPIKSRFFPSIQYIDTLYTALISEPFYKAVPAWKYMHILTRAQTPLYDSIFCNVYLLILI